MGQLYLLYESASGYSLFEHIKSDHLGTATKLDEQVKEIKLFSQIVKLKAFIPFISAANALEQINSLSEGEVTEMLHNFLEQHLGKKKKEKGSESEGKEKDKITLGVTDPKLGNVISETMGFKVKSNELILELLRGIRLHFHRFIKELKPADLIQASLGLSHSYSRSKVKFNVHRVDNMIIQSIALLDQLDKDLNTFAMRVREWYSWHFPELIRIVNDNYQFAKCATIIKNRKSFTSSGEQQDQLLEEIEKVIGDNDKAKAVLEAAKHSMGTDISEIDLINIDHFATRVVELAEYRKSLHEYLIDKMNTCAPNLSALIGEQVGARLIAHAGSLTSLAKYPASTVQILGAEKALFRALKTKGNTPKYGLIFHSSFIGRAATNIKGRISRYLANKCSIASRIDSFGEISNNVFGNKLKSQVEERLEFYKTGKQPRKNTVVMAEALAEAEAQGDEAESTNKQNIQNSHNLDEVEEEKEKARKKKEKKEKKKRKAEEEENGSINVEDSEKKSKKKEKKKDATEVQSEPVQEPAKKKKKEKKSSDE